MDLEKGVIRVETNAGDKANIFLIDKYRKKMYIIVTKKSSSYRQKSASHCPKTTTSYHKKY